MYSIVSICHCSWLCHETQNSAHIYLIMSYLLCVCDLNGWDPCYHHKHTQTLMHRICASQLQSKLSCIIQCTCNIASRFHQPSGEQALRGKQPLQRRPVGASFQLQQLLCTSNSRETQPFLYNCLIAAHKVKNTKFRIAYFFHPFICRHMNHSHYCALNLPTEQHSASTTATGAWTADPLPEEVNLIRIWPRHKHAHSIRIWPRHKHAHRTTCILLHNY